MKKSITWISKKYRESKLLKKNTTFNDFVDVFEDKVNGWYLDWADNANKRRHSGFITLLIGFSYFEAITIFKNGKEGGSRKDFEKGFQEIFQDDLKKTKVDIKKLLKFLYEEGRCGFFHSGMARKGIHLQDGKPTIRILATDIAKNGDIIRVRIDRFTFIERIKEDFQNYITKLKDPSNKELREKFKKSWNKIHLIQI